MNFSISRSEFYKTLQKVIGVVPSRSTLQILTNILIYSEAGKLRLMGTDLELTMLASVDADITTEGGIAVPAKILNDILKELPDETLNFEIDNNHRITLKSSIGEYKISGESQNEFPDVPNIEAANSMTIDAATMKRLVSLTVFAASSDELRPALTGVLFHLSGENAKMVATDGHRLAYLTNNTLSYEHGEAKVIFPTKALTYLVKLLEETEGFELSFNNNHAQFNLGETQIYTKLINEDYPDYEHALPKGNQKELVVNSAEIIASVKRTSLFSSQITNQIRLSLQNNKIDISAEDVDAGGAANESIACNYDSDPLEIGYNATYLLDILRHIDTNDILMKLESPLHGALVYPSEQAENEEYVMLIMPVRLNDR